MRTTMADVIVEDDSFRKGKGHHLLMKHLDERIIDIMSINSLNHWNTISLHFLNSFDAIISHVGNKMMKEMEAQTMR